MTKDFVLIDTSVWIAIDKSEEENELSKAVRILIDEDRVATCGVIMSELLSGTKTIKEYDELLKELSSLHYLSSPEKIWVNLSQFVFHLRRKGINVPITDALIACIAIENNSFLLHIDNHFHLLSAKTKLKTFQYKV